MPKELDAEYLSASKAPWIVQKDLAVPVPNGDKEVLTVYFRKISAKESGDFQYHLLHAETQQKRAQSLALAKVKFVAMCLCDKEGRLYYENHKGITDLSGVPTDLLEILYDAASEINPIGDKREQKKLQEEEEKNS